MAETVLQVMFCDAKAQEYLDFCFGHERATEEKFNCSQLKLAVNEFEGS